MYEKLNEDYKYNRESKIIYHRSEKSFLIEIK